MPERGVSFPVIARRIRNYALHSRCGVFTGQHSSAAIISIGNRDGSAVGIKEHLGRVESEAVCGIGRAIDAIRIELARSHPGHKDMPIMVGAVSSGFYGDYACGLRIVSTVKE